MCSEFENFLQYLNFLIMKEAQDKKIRQLEDRIAHLERSLTGIYPGYYPVKQLITKRE
jgi:hypothetical protein